MILSHKHRYIFLHCRKTAGSSIAVSLARSLGSKDLLLSALVETQEYGIALPEYTLGCARKAARFHLSRSPMRDWTALRRGNTTQESREKIKDLVKNYWRPVLGRMPEHADAKKVSDIFPEEWNAYQKFCVVRNPWTKTISEYHYQTNGMNPKPSFEDFVYALRDGDALQGATPLGHQDNWKMYTIGDTISVDYAIRFEKIERDLPKAMAKMGIPYDGWLPKAKGEYKKKSTPVHYTPETEGIIGDLYSNEISNFNYKPPRT